MVGTLQKQRWSFCRSTALSGVAVISLLVHPTHAQLVSMERANLGLAACQQGKGSLLVRAGCQKTTGFSQGARIFGGHDVDPPDSRPWQAALLHSWTPSNLGAQFCGGVFVGQTLVITAAHCVDSYTQSNQVDVLLGTSDLASGGKRVSVSKITLASGYDGATFNNDIAILALNTTTADLANLGPKLKAIALVDAARQESLFAEGVMGLVTGWGRTEQGLPVVPKLREVPVPIVTFTTCNDVTGYNGRVTQSMLCAGLYNGGADTCTGDSGGPLAIQSQGAWILGGLTSNGLAGHCGDAGYYGIYTKIGPFRCWIYQSLGRPCN
jgi:secreted trypsin-like serine protease